MRDDIDVEGTFTMTESRMPTTLPSPVGRDEFPLVAVGYRGRVLGVDRPREMAWVRVAEEANPDDGSLPAAARGVLPPAPTLRLRRREVDTTKRDLRRQVPHADHPRLLMAQHKGR